MTPFQTAILGLSLSWVPGAVLVALLLWRENRKTAMKLGTQAD
jgi:hypothetical protein